ncbi:similar to Uncharacterized protein conserved in bacteria with a cystatin-like fold [Ectocarpus siliculosus]|uniref:Similar to Uncharacterized protein conserved in bacteria with a cystatin-like fold n=1 Tax=Ectocarpus siliculosus TaxID=2880 RepID=D7FUF8_ECTSI|nr:similar to Uncharacterized protein conserved in bacteria with a cystatin-like fold [Ectocarpus siliculosus]|eukprot:CBJ26228.1 similar to Uncharacterized protein conserved in bacteria with a cystatin-like fold [Ectocarpus siliculosus]
MERGRMDTTTLDRVSRLASNVGDAASISVSLGQIDWDIKLVDQDVRKLLAAVQGTSKQTYAGTSNETEQGRAFLQKQLDGLMKEKAQYKEKRLALLQLQDELPGIPEDGEYSAPAGKSPGVATTEAEDQKAVADTTLVWKETVTSGTYDAPKKTAALYAEDGVLWGTVSEEVRDTPEQIYAYFDYFARLPELRVVEYTPVAVRVYGDFAIQAGTYTFAFQGADGATVEKRARFSFTFRRDRPGSPQPWTIVEHHSSSMPTAPAGLKRVGPNADLVKVTPKKVEITPDQKAVAATTIVWKDTVTLGTDDAPKKTAALYAADAVLWGTVSEEVRETPEQIYDYFDFFARLPKLRLVEYTPAPVRVYGQFAVEAGTYTFAWQGDDGKTVEKRARFSFTFRRDKPGSPQPWTIVEHHSSSMPIAPAELKPVEPEVDMDTIVQAVSEVSVADKPPPPAAAASSSGKGTSFFRSLFGGGGGEASGDSAKPSEGQTFKPDTHAVDVTVSLGQHGLGLVLGKEEAGSRWAVKGFRDMPDGQPNPASAGGIEVGDTLQKLDGVTLGSYKDGMEMFKKQSGSVVITVLRQDEITI